MNDPEAQELHIYEVTNKVTGEKLFKAAPNAQKAAEQTPWLIENCFVCYQKPVQRSKDGQVPQPLVRIPCLTCPWQYGVCNLPEGTECPARPQAPELQEWLKQAAEAHLCPYQGEELTKRDHQFRQKWVTIEVAIKELSPKP